MKAEIYNTFWKIIEQCRIEIPIIQRDYTYGRKTATTIKEKIVKDIFNALENEDSFLHLDFIYGKLVGKENLSAFERNKTNIKSLLKTIQSYASELEVAIDYNLIEQTKEEAVKITFIPLDGQQRLTTLFLVHWYLVQHLKFEDDLKILNKFSYATRVGAKDFCQLITTTFFDLKNSKMLASELISNNEDYYSDWIKDPTVISMLSVIDEIDKVFKDSESKFDNYWTGLTQSSKITFDFFDLDDFELTDELYIKMNARGKKLTHFENFKAWLIKTHTKDITLSDWKKNIDISWTDLFWNEKNHDKTTIDSAFLQYFKSQYLGDYLSSAQENYSDSYLSVLRENSEENAVEIFNSSEIFEGNINDYLVLLNYFDNTDVLDVEINQNFLKGKIRNFIFSENNNSTWWDNTFYYAISKYLLFNKGEAKYFSDWARVVSNLIYNTTIDKPKLFIDACLSINKLIKHVNGDGVYLAFSKIEATEIDFFSNRQKEEEIIKSRKIIEDENWLPLFDKYEKQSFFYGQIGFIFKISSSKKITDVADTAEKISSLFSKKVMDDKSYLLFRALLTYENIFFKNGNTFTYPWNIRDKGTLRQRNENWRKVINNNIEVFESIINDERFKTKHPIKSLEKIIDDFKSDEDDFVFEIIKSKNVLEYPDKNHIRKYVNGYYLLNKTRIYGYYAELYTYNWYLKNKQKGIKYIFEKSESNLHKTGIKINGSLVYFDKDRKKFKINNFDREYLSIDEAIKNIK